MSVINQMLKDLEQRSPESNQHSTQVNKVALAYSPRKIALVTGICVFAVCLLGFYVWQLINENNTLKSQQIINSANAADSRVNSLVIGSSNNIADVEKAIKKVKGAEDIIDVEGVNLPSRSSSDSLTNSPTSSHINKEAIVKPSVALDTVPVNEPSTDLSIKSVTEPSIEPINEQSTQPNIQVKPSKNKMSVSRRQLSADELAEQKIALAEKALAAKQIEKAEQLLEDAVIIRPNDSQTRKKLAALWFGRQAYQDAVNLLSQGIALNSKDSSLRMMKARIHLKQGQVTAALNTLKPLAQLKDEQYQTMLANTAQQAQQNKVAVNAYKMLITMQPDIGRWYLGLAVLYDQKSQFTLASAAYKKALTKNDLSFSSQNFVNERIQAIGQ